MPTEMDGAGLPPEGPIAVKIAPGRLQEYFESIEEPFHETERALNASSPIGWFVGVFVFCLIPLVPYALSRIAFWIAAERVVSVYKLHFHIASFWFWWVLSFTISLTLLILVAKFSGPDEEEEKKRLSAAQMRFAYCYAAIREIHQFKTNQRGWHIEAALRFFNKTASSLVEWTVLDFRPESSTAEHVIRRDVVVTTEHGRQVATVLIERGPKWYRLRPETETILKGLQEFVPKLRDRLEDKKDLASVEAALIDLAAYHYTEIPEFSDSKSETRFEEGTELLLSFANQVLGLPPYHSEPLNPTPKEKVSRKLVSAGSKLSMPLTHENVLVALGSWLLLTSLLFWGGFYVALRLFAVRMDSTIMTALIGGPVATAVTGATIPRLGKAKKQEN